MPFLAEYKKKGPVVIPALFISSSGVFQISLLLLPAQNPYFVSGIYRFRRIDSLYTLFCLGICCASSSNIQSVA